MPTSMMSNSSPSRGDNIRNSTHDISEDIRANNIYEASLHHEGSIDIESNHHESLSISPFNSLSPFFQLFRCFFLSSWINWAYASCIFSLSGYPDITELGGFSYNTINSELILL